MAGKSGRTGGIRRSAHLRIYRFLEGSKFIVREYDEEGLQEHDGLAEAGVQVVVRSVHDLPVLGGLDRSASAKILGGLAKVPADIDHHLLEGTDFMEKLGALGEQDAAEQIAHFSGALLAGTLEIGRIQRCSIGNYPVMSGMLTQRAQ